VHNQRKPWKETGTVSYEERWVKPPRSRSAAIHTAVLLPGTGSDEVFVRSVFEVPLRALGVRLVTPSPRPGPGLAEAHLDALSEAASEPILAGGISFGAHLAAEWALANPSRCAGLLIALPAWNGMPDKAPAAISARMSADAVRRHGVDDTLAAASADVEPWLANELDRSWRRAGDGLADSLEIAASRRAPALEALAAISVPTGIAACVDDPIHPASIARQWAGTIPNARLCTTTLRALGEDRESLGRAAVLAWLRANEVTLLEQ
jgi:pimeloyl-ACP methyl ester carboxylesterase